MKFNQEFSLLLFGGGPLLPRIAMRFRGMGHEPRVVIAPRNVEEIVPGSGMCLTDFLTDKDVEAHVSSDVNTDPQVLEWIDERTLGISIGAAWIFRSPFIERFRGHLLNLHPASLPRNRGGAVFSWQILQGVRNGATVLHQVLPGVDSGAIVASARYVLPHDCRIPSDYQAAAWDAGEDLVAEFVDAVSKGKSPDLVHQPGTLSTYWPRMSTDHNGWIDWRWKLDELERFICAFDHPYDGASTILNGERVRVRNSRGDHSEGGFHPFQAGIVFRRFEESIYVATRDGTLLVGEVVDMDNKSLNATLRVGDRFHTPQANLDEALQYRARYSPDGLQDRG